MIIDNIEEFKKQETRKLLNDYRMPVNWLGYKFLVTAVPYAINKMNVDEKIVLKRLYEFVAKRHKTTCKKVECAIRYFHESTDIAKKMNCDKVTNLSLIVNLATTLMNRYKL